MQLRLEEYIRCFVKTVMGNTIPVMWLFYINKSWQDRVGLPTFWTLYAIVSIAVTVCVWWANSTSRDPTHKTLNMIPTPVFGLVTASYQPIIFLTASAVHRFLK